MPSTTSALARTPQALASGIEPLVIIRVGLMPGMNIVGENFASREFFLPDLIIAADGMKRAMELLEPELRARQQVLESPGTVVIGTVKGDIHEIGKSLVATMLSANGFKVHDLGRCADREIYPDHQRYERQSPGDVCLVDHDHDHAARGHQSNLESSGIRPKVKVMVGGAPVPKSWAPDIGADGYAQDAMGAVQLAKSLVGK